MFRFRTLSRLKLYHNRRCNNSQFLEFNLNPLNPFSTSSHKEANDCKELSNLPGWLKLSDKIDSFYHESDGDFGIRHISNWAKDEESEIIDQVGKDADEVSKVLNFRFESPDAAAEALNVNCSGIIVSEDLASKLLSRFGNDYVRAFGVFKWLKLRSGCEVSVSANLYNQMVDILGKCKAFDEMWELVNEMNEFEKGYVSLTTMTKVIRRFAKAGEFNEAIEAFMCVEKFGLKRDVEAMNILLDPLVRGSSVETATSVFTKFKNEIQPSLQTYNILIQGWCKARRIDRAYKVLKEMDETGVSPDTATYNNFVEYYCRAKDFVKVEEVFNEMREKGCRLSVATYTIYAQALGKSKKLNEALEVYQKMKTDGCNPDATFYSILISQVGKSGSLDDGLALYNEMVKEGVEPNLMTYNALIKLYCLNAREEDALTLLLKMKTTSVKPDVMTYEPLLKMSCRKKQMKALAFLLDHMFKNDVSPDVGIYTLLVNELCKVEKDELACLFFEEMVQTGYTPLESTYKSLIKLLDKNGMGTAKEHVERLYLREDDEMSDDSNGTIFCGFN